MVRLISSTFGLLADFVVGWLVPIIGTAILMPLLAVIVATNHWVGSAVAVSIFLLVAAHHIRNMMWWQLGVIGGIFIPLIILAIFAPQWAMLWTLFIQGIAVGLLLVPGAVLPIARRIIISWLMVGIIITLVLSGVMITGGEILIVLLGLLALGGGTILFSGTARPWEVRRAQRQSARLLTATGIILIIIGLWGATVIGFLSQLPQH